MKNNNYYGSDLNQFIDERCSHKMTCMNIDCYLIKIAKKRIRFIESKHSHEGANKGQRTGLLLLSRLTHPEFKTETYLVRGEYPYNTATVEDMQGNSWELNQRDLILWLDFDIELEDIQRDYTSLGDSF